MLRPGPYRPGMTPRRRWILVATVALLLAALPFAPRLLPVADSDISATDLLAAVRASGDQPYSGYVETTGAVQLAVGSDFDDVGALLGERNRLRVWWRDDNAWRVDRLEIAGETDLVHDGDLTTSYDYQRAKAATSRDPEVRLPRTADLVPPSLARTATTGITDDEVSRLPSRRVAGVAAPGLRITPRARQTTVDHVDLWADPATGLVLRAEVHGTSAGTPAFVSQLTEYEPGDPGSRLVGFGEPAGVERSFDHTLDIVDAANQYAPYAPPERAGGLTRTGGSGAVAVYGEGLTRFVAVPLRERDGGPLNEQLSKTAGSVLTPDGVGVRAGPLTLFVAKGGSWLLAGTVTVETLERATRDVVNGSGYYVVEGR